MGTVDVSHDVGPIPQGPVTQTKVHGYANLVQDLQVRVLAETNTEDVIIYRRRTECSGRRPESCPVLHVAQRFQSNVGC